MVETILLIIANGLPILDKLLPDQATKIRNEYLKLRRAWDAEISKGDLRDDNYLDHLTRELCDLGELFANTLKSAASKS